MDFTPFLIVDGHSRFEGTTCCQSCHLERLYGINFNDFVFGSVFVKLILPVYLLGVIQLDSNVVEVEVELLQVLANKDGVFIHCGLINNSLFIKAFNSKYKVIEIKVSIIEPILKTQVISVIGVISIDVSLNVECCHVARLLVSEVADVSIQLGFRVLFGILLQIKTIVWYFFGNLYSDWMRYQVFGIIWVVEDIAAIVLAGINCMNT